MTAPTDDDYQVTGPWFKIPRRARVTGKLTGTGSFVSHSADRQQALRNQGF
ncbi:hypothetical protein [Amycolatopsis sp. NPDC059657]|uniref:hypothetical protein n=1 Tax=Amycolatopsis sp. NPDC059657 TaxID=3346899 RepID=UPI00366BE81D